MSLIKIINGYVVITWAGTELASREPIFEIARIKKYFNAMCRLYSILFLFVQTYLMLFPMWLKAYFLNGEATIYINRFGEANIELVFWAVSFPFIIYGVWLNCRSAVSQFDRDTKGL